MESTTFKDNPKFLILSTVLVPISISVIGLAGTILPNLVNTSNNQPQVPSTVSEPSKPSNTTSNVVTPKDSFGYMSYDEVINSINSTNINLDSNKSDNDFEIQFISGEYYLLGYVEDLNIQGISLSPKVVAGFKNIVAIKFKDITSIKKEDIKEKKNTYKVLTLNTKGLRSDLTIH